MITERKKKNYIKGGARTVTFSDGELINVDLLLSDLQKLPVNKTGYIKLTLSKNKVLDKFNNSHNIYENDFVPSDKSQAAKAATPVATAITGGFKSRTTDDLPF